MIYKLTTKSCFESFESPKVVICPCANLVSLRMVDVTMKSGMKLPKLKALRMLMPAVTMSIWATSWRCYDSILCWNQNRNYSHDKNRIPIILYRARLKSGS